MQIDYFIKIITTLIFLSVSSPLLAIQNSVNFKNFSSIVTLTPLKDGLYQLQGAKLEVQLAPRLVVKTSYQTTNADLMAVVPNSSRITDLFLLKNHRYVLMHFSDQYQALQALERLQEQPFVTLVQPDLQQRRSNAEVKIGENSYEKNRPPPNYLSLVQKNGLWPGQGGTGVTVAIIDDGFIIQHPELNKLHTKFYYDFADKKIIKNSQNKPKGSHGTKVAGILFGVHNGIAPEGLAPKANFVGIGQADTWTSQTLQSFYLAYLAKADVVNCSWHSWLLLEPVQDVVNELSTYGRDGKGTAVVFAAGNEGKHITPYMHEASIESAIVVGAKRANGRPQKYSNFGETVDIWAFGEPVASIDNHKYYSHFSGTSLAAAIATGYIALLLEKNPALSLIELQNQLKEILSK